MQSPSRLNLYQLHYDLGHLLYQQGDLVGAARSYQQAIEIQPDSLIAHLNLGVVLDAQGYQTQAAQQYRTAIALQPDYVKAYNNLGCTLAKLRQWDEAIQVYEQALEIQPDWAVLHDNLAQVLANQGNAAAAIAAYQRAIQLQPDLAPAHYHLGKVLQSQGQHSTAIEHFQQAIHLQFDDPMVYTEIGVSWMAQGKVEQAFPFLRSALQAQTHLVQAYWQWTNHLATRSGKADQLDAVTQARITCGQFLQRLQENPHVPELLTLLAQTYLHWANALMQYGGIEQYQQAQTYYQQVLQLQPTHLEAYLNLADCLTQQGRSNAAILLYHLALAAHPQQAILHRQ
ncbi:MAG TPA: tetratricopeptide repeat protein, partial [Allocoleopsis sp.]